ncbi:DUF4214 domain-containing protein [Chelatococcus asaccharovorans]|uniref:Uncharacterized protein DUF4214 n=1 Tax=Chelatococcus asaccharovorans TaxID=28210 RepID=A0A2V3TRM7_9HYPH|nr:DUF4214 domain-containing protein [Chelatococcus asaccharovorans]MBS7703149.1 DUF4214 domain-containing protein [Chelatococcus asaccharovorans]PXW50066.1 uncharacterized protein DUF4214 [Chelatococcus asaccharovorans]
MATTDAASSSLIPAHSPFSYNVGINYESWDGGRVGRVIANDLDAITQNFKLIRTYHDAAVGTSDPTAPIIEPTQQEVISYVLAHPGLELSMGTNNNALANGGYGAPWSPGLMVDPAYTDQWVAMIIEAFGSTNAVEENLKMILLGNELDANGPPPGDPLFETYYSVWIPTAFQNLQTSLANAGLGSIPISTTIANYGTGNVVSTSISSFIETNWSASWNGGEPIVLYNQYTPDNGSSTDYSSVISYFESLATTFDGALAPFIGETGFSTLYGQPGQVTVYSQIFDWLNSQWDTGHKTVPLFAFDAFDQPAAWPDVEKYYGIYTDSGSLKPGLAAILPSWLTTATSTYVEGTAAAERFFAKPGNDIVDPGLGDDVLALGGTSARYSVALSGAVALVTDLMTNSTDVVSNVQALEFADGTKALFATDQTHIAALYEAMLGRDADSAGLAFWASQSFSGTTFDAMASAFTDSAEYAARSTLDDSTWLAGLYDNLLHRAADSEGQAYWLAQRDAGVARHEIETTFILSAEFTSAAHDLVDSTQWMGLVGGTLPDLPAAHGPSS